MALLSIYYRKRERTVQGQAADHWQGRDRIRDMRKALNIKYISNLKLPYTPYPTHT